VSSASRRPPSGRRVNADQDFVAALAELDDPNERAAEAAALIQGAMAARGTRLVVVGGSAIAVWIPDLHVSVDIDLVGVATPAGLDRGFGELGFHRHHGRHWRHHTLPLAVEVPGTMLEPRGAAVARLVTPAGRALEVISIEDLILDRLEQYLATGSEDVYRQAAALDRDDRVDHAYLTQRGETLGLADGLALVRQLRELDLDTGALHRAQQGLTAPGGSVEQAMAGVREYLG
jgi:hypothetical protein